MKFVKNCETCDHKADPEGGWCYMFKDEPAHFCAKHTAPPPRQPEQAEQAQPVANLTVEQGRVSIAAVILPDGVYELYTAPPSQPWVGLTAKEKKEINRVAVYVDGAIRLTEAKLKEKNNGN